MQIRRWPVVTALMGLWVLTSAEKCPVQVGDGAGQADGADSGEAIDLAGAAGSTWQLEMGPKTTVTLVAGEQRASTETEVRQGTLTLLGRQLALGDFCWRTDVVCPHQLLPQPFALLHDAATSQVGFEHTGTGPLSSHDAPLIGIVNGSEVVVPLGQVASPATGDHCALLTGSAIVATLLFQEASDEETPRRVARIEGRIALVYGGDCITVGGSGVLQTDDRVEISAKFSAGRLDLEASGQ